MRDAGYLYKKVAAEPDWLKLPGSEIYSVSSCISKSFYDYVPYWRHNGYWLFDSPEIIETLAAQNGIDLSGMRLFYYEVHERQFNEAGRSWDPFEAEPGFATAVRPPATRRLHGFDVVTFSGQTAPECSPLSCCALATRAGANLRCLFDSFELAERALEQGLFDASEPGPFRIFAVHTVP